MSKRGLLVVSGALFNDKGEVFMGFRKATGKRPSLWELPGGKVEPGETRTMALQREWQEEVGVEIEPVAYVATAFLDLEISFRIDLYVVRMSWTNVPKALDHQELRWVDPMYAVEHLPCSPAFYMHYPRLRAWLEESRR